MAELFRFSKRILALQLTKRILNEAKAKGADCIVLACPPCDSYLELRKADRKEI
ncbi:MAG: heterodisulfide reductase-related iron-sulfur binding cluster [Geminocystis sp.]|nr:heterodisulfide reductase-related iron-sulfur binding cluster [Geminocystis sp.]MCS7146662.1 heterodisulfide reductase-related iron-sulfur binding cluster [Geminocystis sp.]MCX8077189.1 heterodisulfide reductase-related iron-sulfur binding cluster [Geminocystis sp.]MDW8115488.1 heterodisulfide reductase-related iron-sulfur binding cluster [Geminocystis sp.]MDW8463029.1 heterodisulfide reductase-related iron-sulfur binding cluster [Geminocystis sp.]